MTTPNTLPDPAGATGRTRTLVVEDNDATRRVLCRVLRSMGHEVLEAATVHQGLRHLEQRPRVLLLDLELPDGFGTDVLERARSHALPVRVAVITAGGRAELIDRARRLGAAVLLKPFELRELEEWLDADQSGEQGH